MKLIYAEGTCALAVHILLEELGTNYEAIKVSLEDKSVLESYNPLGYVPVLVMDNGEVMTEATCILQFISENHGSAFLPHSMVDKARCIEWLSFISTELHQKLGPFFHLGGVKESYLTECKEKLHKRLDKLEGELSGQNYLMGSEYTLADMYAVAILRIMEHVKFSFDDYPMIKSYKARLERRSFVKKVLQDQHFAETAQERWQPYQKARVQSLSERGH